MSNETTPTFASPDHTISGSNESLGSWLAQTRAARGLQPHDAARRLGLNPTLIQSIEDDHLERLGPPVFVRGYLTRYARLLEVPEQDVLERYQQQLGHQHAPPPLKVVHPGQRQTRVRDLRGLVYLALVVAISWTALQNINSLDPSRLFALWSSQQGNRVETVMSSSSAAPAAAQVYYPFQSSPDNTATASSTPSAVEPASSPSQPASPAPAAGATPVTPPPATPSAPAQPSLDPAASRVVTATVTTTTLASGTTPGSTGSPNAAKLLLEFSNDCWVEVRDVQGNVLANGLMKANTTHELSGSVPFKVTLGNAPAARIVLDDRLVNTDVYVPRRGTVSRFTLDRGQP